jgi:hypothetical protein
MGKDRVHPVRVQLRDRGQARWPAAFPDPRRQAPSGHPGIHVQQGNAPRPLPERPPPPGHAAQTTSRRKLRRDRLGDRDPGGRAAIHRDSRHPRRQDDPLLRRRRTGQPPRWQLQRRVPAGDGVPLPLECAGSGEDGRGVGRAPPLRRAHSRRVRARRGVVVHRQEPVDVPELPARACGSEGDRQGLRPVDDRDRPGADRHGQARRLPPARAAWNRRVVPGGDGRRACPAGSGRPRVPDRTRDWV